ncbi:ABC transporter permease [Bifidobacterium cuniculi]|uniref:ABC transporter permease n=1 Tax=Bifidobacterium cuniculi TaxID=1688 RepID=A0A087AQA7_9BIFI|nr:ABC transporter permease [Bifidobacterium cuniculi]KFI60957.1 ABC transporter permease [Bifidobacterium cuniculi]
MFIVRNALCNVTRNKGRNALMIIIVAIITAAATVALAIVQAAQQARASALDNTTITAQISLDRRALMGSTQPSGSDGTTSGEKPDMSALQQSMADKQLTLADYEEYAKADYGVRSSYYTVTASLAAAEDGIEPVDSNGTVTSSSEDSSDSGTTDTQDAPSAPDGGMGGGMGDMRGGKGGMTVTTGDFSLVGFSSDEAILNAPNGSFTMSSGEAFGYGEDDADEVIVSDTLAQANGIEVGDKITVANAADTDTDYTFTVVGIYSNATDEAQPQGGPMASTASDPANAIYTNEATLTKLGLTPDKTMEITDSRGNTRTVQSAQLSFTYVFAGKEEYDRFVEDVRKAGLGHEYTISSEDVERYEQSMVAIDNLSKFATTMLIVVLAVGAVVLMVLTVFNIRERKYEIGVLTAIGVKKAKVATQFAVELLVVTLVGLAVGIGVGAATSVPVSNALLSSQVEQQSQQMSQFGRQMQRPDGGSSATDVQQAAPQLSDAPQGTPGFGEHAQNMIDQLNATVNWATIGWMLLVGVVLTLLSALVAAVFVMRYEPLRILADRS